MVELTDVTVMWHYVQNGQACGPIDASALQALLQSSSLGPDTLVWQPGMPDWVAARSVAGFAASVPRGGTPPPVPLSVPPPAIPGASLNADALDIEHNKIFAVLAYIGILFLVPLLAAPQSRFARYHTNQGIVLFLSVLILSFALGFLAAIPIINIILIPIGVSAWFLLSAGGLVFMIIGIIHAVSGEYKPLPWIGHFRLLS
ncbi:MAG: GYF domain-containing protein [Limisphaerales bacterium]